MNFGDQICCVPSDKMLFEVFSSIWSHVNENEKMFPKIQNLKFRQSLYNFGRDLPRSLHEVFVVNLLCSFRGDVV